MAEKTKAQEDRIEEYEILPGAAAPYGAKVRRNIDTGEVLSVERQGGTHPGDSPFLGTRELVEVFDADDPRTALGVESHIVRNASGVHEETHVAIQPAASAKGVPDIKDLDPKAPVKIKSAAANDPDVNPDAAK